MIAMATIMERINSNLTQGMKGIITEQVYICVYLNYQCRSHGYHRSCCSPCTVGVFEDVPQPREGQRWGPGGNGCTDVTTGTAHKEGGDYRQDVR